MPTAGCAILISRGDPPAEMARLRANRAVATLGWEDLRLTREETASIARQRRRDLPREALEQLYARTQGWAAGLVLMLEQSKVSGAIADPPDLASSQLVFDYLAGEIFQKTDAGTQELLLRTAYVTPMSAGMAQELSGDEREGQILAELHRSNYFVALRQAHPEPVYQYHPMFREFLVARIQDGFPKEGRFPQGPAQALAESRGRGDGRRRAGGGGGGALPREPRLGRDGAPHRCACRGDACAGAQLAPREARVLFERAFDLFRAQSPPDLTGMVLAGSGAMDAILYELDDFSLLDRWIAVVDEAEKGGVRYPSPAVESRATCSMVFSLTLRQPHRRDLQQSVERALACAHRVADPNLKMFVGLLCSLTLRWTGLYGKALALIEAMRRTSAAPGVSPFSLLTLRNLEAMYHMLTADR